MSVAGLVAYIISRSRQGLVWSVVGSMVALYSRFPHGMGILVVLVPYLCVVPRLTPRGISKKRLRSAAAALAGLIIFFLIQYYKFGTFNPHPLSLYRPNGQDVSTLASLYAFRASNIPISFWAYINPANISLSSVYPYFDLVVPAIPADQASEIYIESLASLSACMPALVLAAIIGALAGLRLRGRCLLAFVLPHIATVSAALCVLGYRGMTFRYLHDFMPVLLLLSVHGFSRLEKIELGWLRRLVLTAATGATLWGTAVVGVLAANCAR